MNKLTLILLLGGVLFSVASSVQASHKKNIGDKTYEDLGDVFLIIDTCDKGAEKQIMKKLSPAMNELKELEYEKNDDGCIRRTYKIIK